MAGYLIRHSSRLSRKIENQGAFPLQSHQILADIEGPGAHGRCVFTIDQHGIFPLEHETATGNRNHDIVAAFHPTLQRADICMGCLDDRVRIPDVERGHAATLLIGKRDLDSVLFQHLDGGLADIGRLIVHQTTGEQRDLAWTRRREGARATTPPPIESFFLIMEHVPITVDAQHQLEQATNPGLGQRPVDDRRQGTIETPQEIRLNEQAVPLDDTPRCAAKCSSTRSSSAESRSRIGAAAYRGSD